MTDPIPTPNPTPPEQPTPAAVSKMARFKELSRKAWEAYLLRLKKRIIMYGAVAGVAILLLLTGLVTHHRRKISKSQTPSTKTASTAAAKTQPSKPAALASAAPSAAKPAIAVSSAANTAAPTTIAVNPPAAPSQQDLEALQAKAAEEREARLRERQEKMDKAMDACSLEIGILCNSVKDQPDSALRCARRHESDLRKQCLAALNALRAPVGDSNP